ncbi:MAG: glycosyltransferase [Bacteroidetes bacterium]|nr:glycosyltransferase [Bacteroidota bacterium]
MDKQPNKKVSIITIVLNGKQYIEETILSVVNQKIVNLEYIIIDGGSTDGTLEIIEKYKSYTHKVITGKDGGIYQAINKGLALCTHSIVGIIHCGDHYTPNAISRVLKVVNKSDADVLYGDLEIREEYENSYILREEKSNHNLLKNHMSIFHPAAFVKLSVYRTIGGYNCDYKIASDYDLFLNMFINGYKFQYVPFCLASFRPGGISGQNFSLLLKETYLIKKNRIGVISAIFYLIYTIAIHLIYLSRKKIIISIIGKTNYLKMKQRRNK